MSKLEEKKQSLKVRREKISLFMDNLRKTTGSIISEFDETMWHTMVENIMVDSSGKINFILKPAGVPKIYIQIK